MMTRSRDAISRPSFLVGSVRVDVERDKCRALSRSSAIYRSTHAHACLCITRCSICPHTYAKGKLRGSSLERESMHVRAWPPCELFGRWPAHHFPLYGSIRVLAWHSGTSTRRKIMERAKLA
jgi:hypothetical protein